jgi:nucleotide-binding universal stress UspA family protein
MRRIILATDFSKASRKAFAAALAIAKRNHGTLTIAHVIAPLIPISPDQYIGAETWHEIDAQSRRWVTRQLSALVEQAKRAGVRAVGLTAEGNPAERIVRIARAKKADLLVIGTHGRTGLARFFVGSVAGQVVARATCPVMTVRGQ